MSPLSPRSPSAGVLLDRPRSPWRPVAAIVTAAAVVGTMLLVADRPGAAALEGPAPAPHENTVIADVHTDAIATFWEDGQLVLGTLADTPATHTRYDAGDVWFHIDDDSQVDSLAPDLEFVAPAGSTVWRANQTFTENALWPGFSTESVPAGTLDGDTTTLTLENVAGPGDVEIWESGEEGPNRLWSSDENYKAFTRGIVHMHANWAFTAPGTYALTVRADATVAGAPVTDTATYTFVVGDLPEQTETTTSLSASATSVTVGSPVALTATVTPDAVGAVEFRDGTTVLGHDLLEAGSASIDVPDLAVGTHRITAVFVPETSNLAVASASDPVDVTVTDASGIPLGIEGLEDSYEPGDTLTATLSGYTLGEGEQVRWRMRAVGTDSANGTTLATAASPTYSTTLDVSWDGYEISAQVRAGTTPIATTTWSAVAVAQSGPEPVLVLAESPEPFYQGDTATFSHAGQQLAADETTEYVYRTSPSSRWQVLSVPGFSTMTATPVAEDRMSIRIQTGCCATTRDFAIRVVSHGVAVRQSPFVRLDVRAYELNLSGISPVYRDGQTMTATATYYPVRESVDGSWQWRIAPAGGSYTTVAEGTGAPAPLERTVALSDDGSTVMLSLNRNGSFVQTASARLTVVDASADQIVQLAPLSTHYHQGDTVRLDVLADPALGGSDLARWEWLWPGDQVWTDMPVPATPSNTVVAEQALNGVRVRATVDFEAESLASITTAPVTILVDDHGAAPRQTPTIGGELAYTAGDTVRLSRDLPTNGATVLTDHTWERRAPGGDWIAVEGENEATVSFPASAVDHGAQFRVSVLKPTGEVAYGPSPAVTLEVTGDEPGTAFGITGMQESYEVGDDLTAEVTGATLEANQMYRWHIRPQGWTGAGFTLQTSTSPTFRMSESTASGNLYTRMLNASDDGYEISVSLRQCGNATCSTGTVLTQTPWQPIEVAREGGAPTVAQISGPTEVYPGDRYRVQASGLDLAAGETAEFVYRYSFSAPWRVASGTAAGGPGWSGTTVTLTDPTTVEVLRTGTNVPDPSGFETAIRVVKGGVPVRQSAPILSPEYRNFELQTQGLQQLYMEGTNAELSATIYPVRESDAFTYEWQFSKVASFSATDPSTTVWGSRTTPSVSQELTVSEHNEGYLRLRVLTPDGTVAFTQNVGRVYVTDDPNAQLFFLQDLAAHYHQGDVVSLNLTAAPAPQPGDEITWQWKWPGADWTVFPVGEGLSRSLGAEQALHGVQVRATLDFSSDRESIISEPVTISVDDHGSAARQKPTVGGESSYAAGETVTLSRELPADGGTVLTGHLWEKQLPGGEWTTIASESGAWLSFVASAADDDARYRVSIVKPTGEVAYGPSPAVTLDVSGEVPVPTTVTVTGAEPAYAAGSVVSLTATLDPADASDDIRWFTRPTADAEWTQVDGADAAAYEFIVTAAQQVKAAAYDAEGILIAESTPIDIVIDDTQPGVGIELAVSLPSAETALVISVPAESQKTVLSDLTLSSTADRYVSEGEIGGITVTDTRPNGPGWSASGRVRELGTVDGAILPGTYLGWTPKVLSETGADASEGPVVVPGFVEGNGIAGWSILGTAPAGSSTGTSVLGATIRIEAPTTTEVGDYTGILLITVI